MSSILDALRKLEVEKAEAQKAARVGLDGVAAGTEVSGRRTIRIRPRTLIVGGVVFAVLLVALSAGVSMLIVGSRVAPTQVAQVPPTLPAQPSQPPEPEPQPEPEAEPPEPPEPEPEAPKPAAPEPKPAAKAEPPKPPEPQPEPPKPVAPEPKPAAKADPPKPPEPEPEPPKPAPPEPEAAPKPEPLKPAEPEPERAPVATSALRQTEASYEEPQRPASILSYPVLKSTDKTRYGLSNMRVNMVRPASKKRPLASAIINLQQVHVGETIPDTDAVLIGVESRAIGIEIKETGLRFCMSF